MKETQTRHCKQKSAFETNRAPLPYRAAPQGEAGCGPQPQSLALRAPFQGRGPGPALTIASLGGVEGVRTGTQGSGR